MTPPKTSAPPVSPAHSAASSTDGSHKRGGMPNNRRSRLGSPLFSRKSASSAAPPTINTTASQSGSAPGTNATTPSGMNTKRHSESQLIVSPRARGAQNLPRKKLSADFSEGAPSVTQSPKRQSPGVLGPFLTGPLATDYSDAPQQQKKTAMDQAMQLDAAGLVFPTVPAFGDADVAEEASPGAAHGPGGDFAPYPTEERARVVSTCESDASSVMYAASNATQDNYGWTNEQQQQYYQQQQDAYGQQQQYQNGYLQDPNGFNGAMVDASYGANASYADVVSRQRSGSVAMVRSHDTFDSLSEGMVESMSRILSKTNGGRTHNEVQLACLIQKIQTHLKIMGQVSGGIRADYYETASKLKQVLAEKRMLEAHNTELQERIQQLDQDRQYFQMHVLQFQQSQSAILQDSFGHLSQSVADAKQATLDLGARMSYEIAEASRNGGAGGVIASGNSSHLEAKVDRLTQAVLDQRNHAAAAAASTVASKLPPPQSSQSHATSNGSTPAASGWKGPSFLLVGGGLLFWGVSIASVYFGAKSLAIAEFQEQQPQVVSPSLVASDLDMIVDRITQRLQRDGHVAKSFGDAEPVIVDEVKLDEILDNWKAPLEEEPEVTRELEQQQPQIEMTDEIHDIVVDEVTSFIETEMTQPEQIEVAPVDLEEAGEEEVTFESVNEPVDTHSVEDSDDEADDLHVADLEQADAITAEEEPFSIDEQTATETEENELPSATDDFVFADEDTTETAEPELEETVPEIPEVDIEVAEPETLSAEPDQSDDIFALETMIEAVVPADLSFAEVEVFGFETEAAITKDEVSDASETGEPIIEMPSSFETETEEAFESVIPIEEIDDQAAGEDSPEEIPSSFDVKPVDDEDVTEVHVEDSVELSNTEPEEVHEAELVNVVVSAVDEEPVAEELVVDVDSKNHDLEEEIVEEPGVGEVAADNDEEEFAAIEIESIDTHVETHATEDPVKDDEKEPLSENDEEVQEDDDSVLAGVILNPLARLAEALKSSTEFVFGSPDSVILDDNEVSDDEYEPLTSEDNNASDDIEESPEVETFLTEDSDAVDDEAQVFVDEIVHSADELSNVEPVESKPEEIDILAVNAAEDVSDGEDLSSIEPKADVVEESVETKPRLLTEVEVAVVEASYEKITTEDELDLLENAPILQDIVESEELDIAIETEEPEIVSAIDEEVTFEAQEPEIETAGVDSEEESSLLDVGVDVSPESAELEATVDAVEENAEVPTIETVVVGVEGDIVDVTEAPIDSFLSSEVEPESSEDEEETIFYINQDNADEFPFLIESVDGEEAEVVADGSEALDEESALETEEVSFAGAHQEAEDKFEAPESTFEAVEDATGSVLVDQASNDVVVESDAESALEADIPSLSENELSERLAEDPTEALTFSDVNAESELPESVDVVALEESSLAEVDEHDLQHDAVADAESDEETTPVEESDLINHTAEYGALSSTNEEVEVVAEKEVEEVADLPEDVEADDAAVEDDFVVVDPADNDEFVVVASVDAADDSSDESGLANGDIEPSADVALETEVNVLADDDSVESTSVDADPAAEDNRELSEENEAIELASEEQVVNSADSSFEAEATPVENVAEIVEEHDASVTIETPLEGADEEEIEVPAADAADQVESNDVVGENADVSENSEAPAEEEQEDIVIESEPEAVIEEAFSEISEALDEEEAATDAKQDDIAIEMPEEADVEVDVISEEPVANVKPTSFFGF